MLLRIISVALISLLCGCVPLFVKYYEPLSDGLIAHGQDCHNDVGPPAAVTFETGDGQISMWIEHPRDQQQSVTLALNFNVASAWVPDGSFMRRAQYKAEVSTLKIRSTEFAAYAATTTAPLKISPQTIREITRGGGFNRPLSPSVELKALSPSHRGFTWFILYFDIELNGAHEFSIVIPQFTVDGKTSPSRTIKFVEKKGWWISPINC